MKTAQPKKGLLDEYDRNARLKPALLVILPASLTVTALGVNVSAPVGVLTGSLTAIGFTYVLAQFARDRGKRKELSLFALWGGKPTTVRLRHRTNAINPYTLARYHAIATRLVGKSIPSTFEEQNDPQSADLIYESVGDCLRGKTRDTKKYPLIFKELVSYGFRRNLWGMKPFGIFLTSACVIFQLGFLTRLFFYQSSVPPVQVVMAVTNLVILLCWIFLVNPSWVRIPADAYADRLLEASSAFEGPREAVATKNKKTKARTDAPKKSRMEQ
jgi:hypothetical protein